MFTISHDNPELSVVKFNGIAYSSENIQSGKDVHVFLFFHVQV